MRFYAKGGVSHREDTDTDDKQKFEDEVQAEVQRLQDDACYREDLAREHRKALAEIYRSPGTSETIENRLQNERVHYYAQLRAYENSRMVRTMALLSPPIPPEVRIRAQQIFEQGNDFFYEDHTP